MINLKFEIKLNMVLNQWKEITISLVTAVCVGKSN